MTAPVRERFEKMASDVCAKFADVHHIEAKELWERIQNKDESLVIVDARAAAEQEVDVMGPTHARCCSQSSACNKRMGCMQLLYKLPHQLGTNMQTCLFARYQPSIETTQRHDMHTASTGVRAARAHSDQGGVHGS